MRLADDRQHVVLAMGFEADVLQHHHLVVIGDLFEGAGQDLNGIGIVTAEEFLIGARHAVRGPDQSLARGVIAGPADQCTHCLLGFGSIGLGRAKGAVQFPFSVFQRNASRGVQE